MKNIFIIIFCTGAFFGGKRDWIAKGTITFIKDTTKSKDHYKIEGYESGGYGPAEYSDMKNRCLFGNYREHDCLYPKGKFVSFKIDSNYNWKGTIFEKNTKP